MVKRVLSCLLLAAYYCMRPSVSSPLQFHAVDKLMVLTFLFFIFSPSERKDYTLFDVNELCQRLVYRLWGQLLRRAAGLFFLSYLQPEKRKHSQHIQVQASRIPLHLFSFFHFFVSSPHTERQPCACTLISGSTFFF